ncbi:MAG TPA: hypothetical protein VF666_10555 [Pyrinomonadaceae bacterium]|jgi:hypothetical protein
MPEIGGVGGSGVGSQGQGATGRVDEARQANAPANTPTPVGQPGTLGQPVGLPVPGAPGAGQLMPDVLTGRDATQLAAAERMRAAGGASATEQLLGLNQQPSMIGVLGAPPGNSEALRHMQPTMRRTIMRGLLDKQRERMRQLAGILRDSERDGDSDHPNDGEKEDLTQEFSEFLSALDGAHLGRARRELGHTARMLDLLDELLMMQDYALSQMGTFSQG